MSLLSFSLLHLPWKNILDNVHIFFFISFSFCFSIWVLCHSAENNRWVIFPYSNYYTFQRKIYCHQALNLLMCLEVNSKNLLNRQLEWYRRQFDRGPGLFRVLIKFFGSLGTFLNNIWCNIKGSLSFFCT